MAIGFHARFSIFGSTHDFELFNCNFLSRREYKRPEAKIIPQYTHKSNKEYGGKLLELSSDSKFLQKSKVRQLVNHLHWCAAEGLQTEVRIIHGYVVKSDFDDENMLMLLNHVMYAYLNSSDFKSAKLLFDYMPRRNVFSWSVMIGGFNEQALFQNGLYHYCQMMDDGMWPDGFMYSAVLQSCIGMDCMDIGYALHGQIIVRGFGSHVVVGTALLNMYAKLGKADEAYIVFSYMDEHNDVSWNAIISGLTANGLHMEAFDHFLKMRSQGFIPNRYTLVGVLKAVGMLGNIDKGRQVHKCVSELGMQNDYFVGTALIDMYSKCGDLQEAMSVFDMNFADSGVNGPWNAMISAYSLHKCSQQALLLYIEMCLKGIKSDLYTYCSLFDAIANLKCSRLVKEVHGMVLKSGHDFMNLSIENSIADAYLKCGSVEGAKKIFNKMETRDIVSWTTLITGYSQCSKWEEALITFSQMMEEGFTPNSVTLASVLTACANLCYLEYGLQVHGLSCKLGFESVRYVESALIDMYAKGGSIKESEKVFNRIIDPDVVSFTAMLSGYASHGLASLAVRHFNRMKQLGTKPTAVTFLCVLFACSHSGLIEEGLQFFWSMEKDYGIVPKMEHYACVVDLLGRVGRLAEAFEFIMKIPSEPDEMVWQSLLAACRIHGNVEFGEIAAKKILTLRPEYSSTYVLLSNTYIETGSFKDGVDMRKVMKEKGVKKEPGYSWISVEGRIHKFYAGDMGHPQKEDIYSKLEELRGRMKDLGYVPDLKYALLDKQFFHVIVYSVKFDHFWYKLESGSEFNCMF
ncbi:putative pentatricopeptide repeat-containing protein At1g56570 isoform X2 [Andrographis paniculata]|uniref:putative pentatricopeptide repeat-containing protein At1g56570 isoform X2 n=1 Tax=Andrographis paniculata TaxID=175694 RepID=UPI0021E801B6|nr:putative pentatricopeptide repeat-containing protein At1g56570 isoform X2 [Andrographis paniculata]